MMLTVEAVITMFLTTICTWMASTGDAPAIMRPVMAPGKETNPIVLALSMEGAKAIPSALFACWSVAWSGVAPRAILSPAKKRRVVQAKVKLKACLLPDGEQFFSIVTSSWSFFMAIPVTVMALPTIRPAAGMMYRGVNGNTLSMRIRIMVITVPTKMDTKEIYFPRGTCFARWPAV
ncbi:hypothetical protein SETIT_4G246900v2 [Setaria italica]|uniref:Secreted protein n=2 Tax=Setaria TaxID=4554 RepID=A0A368QZR7_SETIT|nr:hypothetical protein SETIT_4G246900v2 [Setaria italica]TKW22917.1 hypothetical protein SEVIR_4G259500v2 [Setaria viridis]